MTSQYGKPVWNRFQQSGYRLHRKSGFNSPTINRAMLISGDISEKIPVSSQLYVFWFVRLDQLWQNIGDPLISSRLFCVLLLSVDMFGIAFFPATEPTGSWLEIWLVQSCCQIFAFSCKTGPLNCTSWPLELTNHDFSAVSTSASLSVRYRFRLGLSYHTDF